MQLQYARGGPRATTTQPHIAAYGPLRPTDALEPPLSKGEPLTNRNRTLTLLVCFLLLACIGRAVQAQIIWSGRGSTRPWDINPLDGCVVPPEERYLQITGTTMLAPSAAYLIVGINMTTTDPDLLALPFDVLVTGHPTGQNPPPGIPPYAGGSPCWHHGVPLFGDDPAMGVVVAASPLNPIPGVGTWRAFVIPLSPQSLPLSIAENVETYFTLAHGGDALGVMDDVKGLVSGIITATVPPDTILRYDAPAFGPQEFTKMHFAQHPDTFGVDINFTYPKVLADDWLCTDPGPIDDIRFWFSAQGDWFDPYGDLHAQISNIHVSIHANIPDPDGEGPEFSRPGALLWEADFPPDAPGVVFERYSLGLQDWYDPDVEFVADDHVNTYECRIDSFPEPFIQEVDSVYWMDLSIATDDSMFPANLLGWKTSHRAYYPAGYADRHFMDDAVWGGLPLPFWLNLTYPAGPHAGQSLDLAFVLDQEIISLAVCHDSLWYDEEYCGFDAYYETGYPEMNHDCVIGIFDLFLFTKDYTLSGPNLSGDFDGNYVCNLADFLTFVVGFGQTATPCTPHPLSSDVWEGMIALSFSANPSTIVSTRTQTPGTTGQVHVIIDGWTNATILEYQIEASSNVAILSHQVTAYPHSASSPITCDPDPQHTYRAYSVNNTTWPSGPIKWATIDYLLLNPSPAYLKFEAVAACPGSIRQRWGKSGADRGYNFKYRYNVGINGSAPTGIGADRTPQPFRIVSVAPNPFNPSTTVHFTLPGLMPVSVEIWSVAGERVRVLADKRLFDAGDNRVTWDGRNDRGSLVASGVYFVRLETPLGVKVSRAVALK